MPDQFDAELRGIQHREDKNQQNNVQKQKNSKLKKTLK